MEDNICLSFYYIFGFVQIIKYAINQISRNLGNFISWTDFPIIFQSFLFTNDQLFLSLFLMMNVFFYDIRLLKIMIILNQKYIKYMWISANIYIWYQKFWEKYCLLLFYRILIDFWSGIIGNWILHYIRITCAMKISIKPPS